MYRQNEAKGQFGFVETHPGIKIRYFLGHFDQHKTTKALIFVNGRNEFIEKYKFLMNDLSLPEDCCFLTWDHRGQGASSGKKAHIDTYDQFAEDAQRVVEQVLGSRCDQTYLLGHSMGGLIILYALARGYLQADKVFLTSPLLGVPNSPLDWKMARTLACAMKSIGAGKLRFPQKSSIEYEEFLSNERTHDPVQFYRLKAAPYKGFDVTFAWGTATFDAIATVDDLRVKERFQMPLYILTAGEESIVHNGRAKKWLESMELNHAQIFELQGAKHEVLAEAEEFYKVVISKLNHFFSF